MFRMNGKNRKKTSKEKKVDSKQKYQEDFNEIILNDLVPEEKREEFGLNSTDQPKENKSNGLKLNFALEIVASQATYKEAAESSFSKLKVPPFISKEPSA